MFMLKKYKNIIVGLILLLSGVILFHNIIFYTPQGGFDYVRRTTYARIISQEFRFPTYTETSEVYDAPAFYFLSGLIARVISSITHLNFLDALANVRFLTATLGLITFYLWHKMFSKFYPKSKLGPLFFLFYLASIPIFYRVGSMIVSELLTGFNVAITFYWFINHFLVKPTYKNSLILSLLISFGLLTRMSFMSVALAIVIGAGTWLIIKKKWLITIKHLGLMTLIILILTGWFYLGRHQGKLLNFGTYDEVTYQNMKHEPIRLNFFYKVPFRLMINYPIRPQLSRPSYFLPIYYSDFWGDYWNYFAQSRFGPNEFKNARANRQVFSDARRLYLAWQIKVNLVPTFLMVGSFIFLFIKRIKEWLKNKTDKKSLVELVFMLAVVTTWLSLLAIVSKYHEGEGDWIKAAYTLYITPIYAYVLSATLFTYLRKVKIIFWPVLFILLATAVNNFIFTWF